MPNKSHKNKQSETSIQMQIQRERDREREREREGRDNALPLKKIPQLKCVKAVLHIDFHVKYTLLLWF